MGHLGQILLSRTTICLLMLEQKYLVLLSFINPPKCSPFVSLTVCSSLPASARKPHFLFFRLLFSMSFFCSGQYAARFVCAALTVTEHRCFFILDSVAPLGVHWANCSLQWQPSSEAYCLGWVCTQYFSHLFSWLATFVPLAYILCLFYVKTTGCFTRCTQMTVFISLSDSSLGVRLTDVFHLKTDYAWLKCGRAP